MKNVNLQKIIYMNTLIVNKRTGTPKQFAEKLKLSRSALFEYLDFLRNELTLVIIYNSYDQTYYYDGMDFCELMGGMCCSDCRKFNDQQNCELYYSHQV